VPSWTKSYSLDWLTFLSKAIGSLSWPIVVLVLIFILRPHFGGLLRRLEELDLPGGTKAKFGSELDKAKETAETEAVISPDDEKVLRLAAEFPEAAILEAYRDVEQLLRVQAETLKLPAARPRLVMEHLRRESVIDAATMELFQRVTAMRNTAVHAAGDQRPTPGEAMEFRAVCASLLLQLSRAFSITQPGSSR
jgi:hypothetical protein